MRENNKMFHKKSSMVDMSDADDCDSELLYYVSCCKVVIMSIHVLQIIFLYQVSYHCLTIVTIIILSQLGWIAYLRDGLFLCEDCFLLLVFFQASFKFLCLILQWLWIGILFSLWPLNKLLTIVLLYLYFYMRNVSC